MGDPPIDQSHLSFISVLVCIVAEKAEFLILAAEEEQINY